jgi:hypothetical protein
MNIQPIIQGGEGCMETATTPAVLTTIWGLHIGIGEDCESTSASRIGTHTIERSDDELAVARRGLIQAYFKSPQSGALLRGIPNRHERFGFPPDLPVD